MLVTIPEETPVNEAVETAFSLEDRVGVGLGPVVVNGVYPDLEGLDTDPEAAAAQVGAGLRPGEADALREAARFRRRRMDLQREQLGRLEERLPLPQLRMPFQFTGSIARAEIDRLAAVLLEEIAVLTALPT
jgi:hypothetical protein